MCYKKMLKVKLMFPKQQKYVPFKIKLKYTTTHISRIFGIRAFLFCSVFEQIFQLTFACLVCLLNLDCVDVELGERE
jgi:hypothetical protein